jgi:mono/diheme cytochrome c family protein
MKGALIVAIGVSAAAFAAAQTAPANEARIASGKRLFTETCASEHCHGGSARSVTDMADLKPDRIRRVIVEGLPDAGMQSFKDVLTPQEIDDIVAYIVSASANGKSEDRTCAR